MSIYLEYWGLDRSPFENNADAEFFFRSDAHQAALLKMRYVVENRLGGGLLVGGTGSGKTYLAGLLGHEYFDSRHAPIRAARPDHSALDENADDRREGLLLDGGPVTRELSRSGPFLVHVLFPQLGPGELLAYLAVELGADESQIGRGAGELNRTIRQLELRLRHLTAEGWHAVIVIDDAHLIDDPRVLETLGLLLNFPARGDGELTLLLLGEPILLGPIERTPGLNERIAVRSLLGPLTSDETQRYIAHRLNVAGRRDAIFDEGAIRTVFELSGGIPRRINRLCDLALLVGYADELRTLSAAEVDAVGRELTAVVPD